MKMKRLMTAICVLTLASVMVIPMSASADFEHLYLVREMTNDDVAMMQNMLIALGYMNPPADGYFGAYTEQAVKEFQKNNGLYVDGEAGPLMLTALYSGSAVPASAAPASAPAPAEEPEETVDPFAPQLVEDSADYSNIYLVVGASGSEVITVQQRLKDLGYLDSPVDGDYGVKTAASVRAFQTANGLYADGEAGPMTLAVLMSDSARASASGTSASSSSSAPSADGFDYSSVYLRVGAYGDDVKVVQQKLKDLGLLDSPVDGDYGQKTAAAVMKYQKMKGLYADGEAGPKTLAVLMKDTGSYASDSSQQSADAQVSDTTFDYTNVYLTVGSTGEEAKIVQTLLKKLGFYDTVIDGEYGLVTASAVRAYQEARGLYADGEAGPKTLAVLLQEGNSETAGDPDLEKFCQLGDKNDDVLALQKKLAQLGYMVSTPDGYYGEATAFSVKLYQMANGLTIQDGVALPNVYKRIMQDNRAFGGIGSNSSGAAIRSLQQLFASKRMVIGADGTYGDDTEAAVLQIQRMFGLPQTGVADAQTIYYLQNYESHVDNANDVQGYYSATDWLIYVNTTTNRMYVYNGSIYNWKLVHNWACATGAVDTPTCLGEYTTSNRGYSFGSDYTCYYFTSFNGPYLFHSTLFDPNTFVDQDPRLGRSISHGCVRLDVGAAQWVYENIPAGTKVVVVQ